MLKNSLGRSMRETRAARFLARFERIRRCIEEEERVLSLFKHQNPKTLRDYEGLSTSALSVLDYLAPTRNEVNDRLIYHYRLFEKHCAVLGKAIRDIREKHLRDYLIWHYFYRFTHEAISEAMNYSTRQIYRIATQARSELNKTLSLPPMPVAHKNRRYRAVRWGKKEQFIRKAS